MRTTLTAILAAFALALALSGCTADQAKGPTYPIVGTVDQTTLDQSAYAARAAYAGALHLMAQYVALPRCGTVDAPPVCSNQVLVNEMRRYERAADTATAGAMEIARSPTRTPIALANAVSDAQRAVAVFRSTVSAVNPKAAGGP